MSFQRPWHKHYPADVPAEPDFEKITMPGVLTPTAGRFPDTTALNLMGETIFYRELESLVNRFARALADRKKKLAPYKVPKKIEFVESLPKSTVGKILRPS